MKEETTLSKHNYSQYSSKKPDNKNIQNHQHHNNQKPKQTEKAPDVKMDSNPVTTEPEVKMVKETSQVTRPSMVKETVETVALPNTVNGTVAHCAKLNVRKSPVVNSEIVCVLDVMSEIMIDVNQSTENWFYVCCANGAEGYCMKQYVDAHM